jgi:hypothetical protein
MTETPSRPRRLSVVIPAFLAVLAWPPVGVVAAAAAMMSPMLYDAPGSEDNGLIAIVIAGTVALPLLCAVSVPACLGVLFRERRSPVDRRWAWGWAGLPLAAVALAAAGWVAISVVCGGSLQC